MVGSSGLGMWWAERVGRARVHVLGRALGQRVGARGGQSTWVERMGMWWAEHIGTYGGQST